MMMISDKMRKSNGLTFVRLPTRHTLDKQIEQTSTMMTMMKMMMMMMMVMPESARPGRERRLHPQTHPPERDKQAEIL